MNNFYMGDLLQLKYRQIAWKKAHPEEVPRSVFPEAELRTLKYIIGQNIHFNNLGKGGTKLLVDS